VWGIFGYVDSFTFRAEYEMYTKESFAYKELGKMVLDIIEKLLYY